MPLACDEPFTNRQPCSVLAQDPALSGACCVVDGAIHTPNGEDLKAVPNRRFL
jgi:hypothetical protein